MERIVDSSWPNLVAYVVIEQLFLTTFRRLDYRIAGLGPIFAAAIHLWLRKQTAWVKATEMGLLLPVLSQSSDSPETMNLCSTVGANTDQVVLDAASNVAILVMAINFSNPALPGGEVPFEAASLLLVHTPYLLLDWASPAEYPSKAVLFSGTWEQVRLLISFLFLRIAAGGLLQAIVLTVSEQSELRIGIIRSNHSLDLDEPSLDEKGEAKTEPKFALNVNVSLILASGASLLAAGLIGGVFVALVKTRDAFAA